MSKDCEQMEQAITAIKKTLAQPEEALAQHSDSVEQEPVAWHKKIFGMEVSMDVSTGEDDAHHRVFGRVCGVMLEASGATNDTIIAIEDSRNFTAPPKRTWVNLPDNWVESAEARWMQDGYDLYVFARAVEAKSKELNK